MAKAKKPAKKAAAKKPAAKPAVKKKTAKPAVKKTPKAAIKAKAKPTAKPAAAKSKAKPAAKKAAAKPAAKAPAPSKAIAPKKAVADYTNILSPLDDRVLVRLTDAERTTASGLLYIPDTVADVSGNLEGVVVSVGRGHRDKKGRLRPLDVKLGDRVLFSSYLGSKIVFNNEELLLVRESELMGVKSK